MSTLPTDAGVEFRVDAALGEVTLARPRTLNAIDLPMVHAIGRSLRAWEADAGVTRVLITGSGDRGLCAGGDMRAIYRLHTTGRLDEIEAFFRDEYRLNAMIAEYPLPVVTVADGITMGGGVGIAAHAELRVVTETSRIAMPETRIGFTPDVGGSWLLSRAPGRIGEYLGVTGASMTAADAIYAGFADVLIPRDRVPTLRAMLAADDEPRAAVRSVAVSAPPAPLASQHRWIDDAFAADDIPGILARLTERPEPEARTARDTMAELSPTAMAITLESVRRARTLPTLRAALADEFALVSWFVAAAPDVAEGIRAQLVDKDRTPRWNPRHIDEVSPAVVADAMAYRPRRGLWDGD